MFAANVNVNVGGDSSDEKYQGMNIYIELFKPTDGGFLKLRNIFWFS